MGDTHRSETDKPSKLIDLPSGFNPLRKVREAGEQIPSQGVVYSREGVAVAVCAGRAAGGAVCSTYDSQSADLFCAAISEFLWNDARHYYAHVCFRASAGLTRAHVFIENQVVHDITEA
jgi:hypothetical protein